MKTKKTLALLAAVLVLVLAVAAGCGNTTPADNNGEPKQAVSDQDPKPESEMAWQYYTADQLKTAIEGQGAMYLLDIQTEEDYGKHHIVGTVATYAYPADTAELTAKLDAVIPDLKSTKDPIIVVCPGGGTGAKNTITYLASQGIPAEQMFILEKGQKGWPYEELLEQ